MPGAQAASDLSRDSRRERRIKKTQTDRDHGDEAHTLYICRNMTAGPIDSGGLGGRPARQPPRAGSMRLVNVPIRPARVIVNRVDVSIRPRVELS